MNTQRITYAVKTVYVRLCNVTRWKYKINSVKKKKKKAKEGNSKVYPQIYPLDTLYRA